MRRRVPMLFVAAVLTACGGGDQPAAAVDTATAWYDAVAEGKIDQACEVMEPEAVASIRIKYTGSARTAPCPIVVRAYVDRLDLSKADVILRNGFEAGERTDSGQLGVFPAAEAYELEIVLLEEVRDEWRIVSVGIPPG